MSTPEDRAEREPMPETSHEADVAASQGRLDPDEAPEPDPDSRAADVRASTGRDPDESPVDRLLSPDDAAPPS